MATEIDRATVGALERRYADAYITARVIDGFGVTVKTLALVFGALGISAAFLLAVRGGVAGAVFAFSGVAATVVATLIVYMFGTVIAAQGQILKATLDTAVNSSPFLSLESRVKIMSLPLASAASQIAPASGPVPWRCPACGRNNEAAAARCALCGEGRVA